jgi:hypothetical protein
VSRPSSRSGRELITGQIRIEPAMSEAITSYAATAILTVYPEPDLAALAGLLDREDLAAVLTFTTSTSLQKAAAEEALTKATADRPGFPGLLAVLAADAEPNLTTPVNWRPGALTAETHRRWLDLLGGPPCYEWTPWEAAQIEARPTGE